MTKSCNEGRMKCNSRPDDENPREVVEINRLQIMTISDEKCKDCYGFTTISMEPYGAHNN